MSTDETSNVPTIWLSVSFDAEQLGANLVWVASEGRENLYDTYGPFAGSLSLPKNCQMRVEIRGYGSMDMKSFEVESAGLMTVPAAPSLAPSPFKHHRTAITLLENFPTADHIVFDPRIERAYGISASPTSLHIGNEDGAWHLSMILTVAIRTAGADGLVRISRRVFRFDPESYVGNGTRPG